MGNADREQHQNQPSNKGVCQRESLPRRYMSPHSRVTSSRFTIGPYFLHQLNELSIILRLRLKALDCHGNRSVVHPANRFASLLEVAGSYRDK